MRKIFTFCTIVFCCCSPAAKNNSTSSRLSAKDGIRLIVTANQSKEQIRSIVLARFKERSINLIDDAEYEAELKRHNLMLAQRYRSRKDVTKEDLQKMLEEDMLIDHLSFYYFVKQDDKGIWVDSVKYNTAKNPTTLLKNRKVLNTENFPDRSLLWITDSLINKFFDINPRS